ncbi:hypothetical protein [Endozoicomonas sp.]|uniref:hypothetical protein n=1 Tax=Endozoicomonas sp. TaxID=1892382 RepID=UPI003AF67FA2
METPSSHSKSNSRYGSYENLSSGSISDDSESESFHRDLIRGFYGHTVRELTSTETAELGLLPAKVVSHFSKKKALRTVSNLFNPFDSLRKLSLASSSQHSCGGGLWDLLDSRPGDGRLGSDEDDWELVPGEPAAVDIKSCLSANTGKNYVVGEDSALVDSLGYKSFSRSPAWLEKLFHRDSPSLRDISQIDKRNTCPIHSVIASFLNSPKARDVLKGMFEEKEGGYVAVTLEDPNIQTITPVVSKSRVFIDGNVELFSSGLAGSVCQLVIEKAFLTANLSDKDLYQEVRGMGLEKPLVDGVRGKLRHSLDKDDNALFDYSDPYYVLIRMPFIDYGVLNPCCEPQIISLNWHYDKTESAQKVWRKHQKCLSDCLKLQIPVVMCTRKLESEPEALVRMGAAYSALKTGSPTGHAMAVIANRDDGILVYDPSGERKGVFTDDMISDAGFKHFKNGPVQLVRWPEVPQRFCMAYLPKGAPEV